MKIKINNEGRKIYVHTDKIRINDLNFGNHVGHQTVYEFCHDARIEIFEKINIFSKKSRFFKKIGIFLKNQDFSKKSR